MNWVRAIGLAAAVGTGLGILFGVLWTPNGFKEPERVEVGAMMPYVGRPVSEKESGIPAYGEHQLRAFTDDMNVQGVPMSTGSLLVSDPIEEVQRFYEKRLSEAGMPVVSKRFPNGLGYVGYRESETNLMHVVTLVPQTAESTLVFVSTNSARDVLKGLKDTKVPSELPHPPGATDTSVMSSGMGTVSQRWVTAQVKGKPMSKVLEFYRDAFVKAGWSLSADQIDDSKEDGWLQASRGELQAQVSLRDERLGASGQTTQIFVMLTDRSATKKTAKAPNKQESKTDAGATAPHQNPKLESGGLSSLPQTENPLETSP